MTTLSRMKQHGRRRHLSAAILISVLTLAADGAAQEARGPAAQAVEASGEGGIPGPPPVLWGLAQNGAALGLGLSFPVDPVSLRPVPTPVALPPAPQEDEQWRDAWGQPRNMGLAVVEAWMGNFLPWVINELVPGRASLRISQLSPRSWWRNLEEGWEWDDNAFQVNHFAHPFQGNIYFNAARSNGYGYWHGLLFATAGSFTWECCGETHFMSINDWANTSLGGAAVGEVLYRTSSRILDNQATGAERFFREAAAFVMNPNRGFTRLVTGNATRVYDNPIDPLDYQTPGGHVHFSSGVRGGNSTRTAKGPQRDESLPAHGFIDIEVNSGTPAELDRGKPFDYFTFVTQVNLIRGRGLGELLIQGNLWHKDLSETESSVSKLVVVQDFEYNNNSSFEQGGQGVSLMYYRRSQLSERNALALHGSATWTILGGVRSEMAGLADVEGIRERFREYDFGLGPGVRVGAEWTWNGQRLFEGSYRAQFLETVNGSTKEGLGSDHLTQLIRLRAMVPFEVAGFGLGADYELYLRRSNFEFADVGRVNQQAGIWQIFARWTG